MAERGNGKYLLKYVTSLASLSAQQDALPGKPFRIEVIATEGKRFITETGPVTVEKGMVGVHVTKTNGRKRAL